MSHASCDCFAELNVNFDLNMGSCPEWLGVELFGFGFDLAPLDFGFDRDLDLAYFTRCFECVF
jgi:hypothetical protein